MKQFFLFVTLAVTIRLSAQVATKTNSKDNVALSPTAKIIFQSVKTKMTNTEKNFFAEGVYVQKEDKSKLTMDTNGEDNGVLDVEIYPTDVNKDGVEEIFIRTSGTFFGQWLPDLSLYIKNKNGKYVAQADVSAPRFYARYPGIGGYPDLVGGAPEGPGFNLPKGPINMYRWNGNNYKLYKKNQVNLKSDKSIEEVISPDYIKTLAVNVAADNITDNQIAQAAGSANSINTTNEKVILTPMAVMLFSNVKTKLSDPEKNDFAQKTGITDEYTRAKTKKGKPKLLFTLYPADLNNDGSEEIFLMVTNSPLGIPLRNYYFFAKDNMGKYQPLPGKIGQALKIILNGKRGYPDLITGVPGFAREVWSWNGGAYHLQQKLAHSTNIPYKTKDIDVASQEYTGRM